MQMLKVLLEVLVLMFKSYIDTKNQHGKFYGNHFCKVKGKRSLPSTEK